MAELNVVATISAKEGTADRVGAALRTLAEASRGDAGCIAYEAYESASTPGTFVTVEKWESQESLDAHMAAPHVAEAFSTLGDALENVAIHPLKSY
ncbi:putative quinol monooxygenase [Williamsia deligens]|uniref:Quinol monooxygenase n=1 Tax=Williamsia deligens TaxID=321325 RepID=A0ABW3G3X8_9NOCA|nr:putative quinol monooxygenase [Williamsia deligens]MCP2194331.1 Quinol monooxygenase YgiN [Williamsia deligens]